MKKWISSLLVTAVLLMMLAVPAYGAMESEVGYRVDGEYEEATNTLRVDIYVTGARVLVGRFALGFDGEQLLLPETTRYMSDTITRGERVELTGEGKTPQELFSQEKGHVMFAWYAYGAALDATNGEHLLGTVRFTLKQGVRVDDLNNYTLHLYSVADGYLGWDSSAWVREYGLIDHGNCVPGMSGCDVQFTYPNSTQEAPDLRKLQIEVRDSAGTTLKGGKFQLGSEIVEAGADGTANFQVPAGTYTFMVTVPGYEEQAGNVTVTGSSAYRTVRLRSMQQLVDQVAAELEIGYQGDDTAEHVTRDLILADTGEQNTTITWSSSAPHLIGQYGNVFRATKGETVRLTATVSKDGRSAVKDFTVYLTAKDVPMTELPELLPVEPGGADGDIVEPTGHFTDLGPVGWAAEAIEEMHRLGIISGTSDTEYSPLASVTRADFITLLMRMFQPEGTPGPGFEDVPASAYYHDPVTLAQGMGIATGYSETSFGPNDRITRQDMIVLTYRAMKLLGYTVDSTGGAERLAGFPDRGSVSAYAAEAMEGMLAEGYINGRGDTLAPLGTTNRAEAAVFLYQIYKAVLGGAGR